jgi:Lysyl oxidase
MTPKPRALVVALSVVLALAVVGGGVAAGAEVTAPATSTKLAAPTVAGAAVGAADRLPDLRMAQLRDFGTSTTSSGRRLLRLTTIILNSGAGPFELLGSRSSTSVSTMTVRQRIYDTGGGSRTTSTDGQGRYAGDGHSHWHIQNVSRMWLLSTNGANLVAGSKVGFCFFDTNLFYPDLPGSPSSAVYRGSGCGGQSSLSVKMGISVGWGDRYQASLPYQWIDITGVASGTYTVQVIVDAENHYLETREANNCSWSRIRLRSSGVDVLEHGRECIGWVPPGTAPTLAPRPARPTRSERA